VLEAARNKKLIGNPLEAKVRIRANQNWVSLLNQYKDFLATLFIVSQVETTSDSLPTSLETGLAGIEVSVERAEGEKCSRCWNYSTGVGRDERYPTVCPRCSKALGEIVPVAS
jgi:isoleucyl-tRNA synthetase